MACGRVWRCAANAGGVRPRAGALLRALDQRERDLTDDAETARADLVHGVVRSVPMRVLEIDHVDRPDSDLLQLDVIVGECGAQVVDEDTAVPALPRDSPYERDHLRRSDCGVAFTRNEEVARSEEH